MTMRAPVLTINVIRFRNGDPIPEIKTAEEWEQAGKQQRPAWYHYENAPQHGKKSGKLYNWYVMTESGGLAAEGWRIPNKHE